MPALVRPLLAILTTGMVAATFATLAPAALGATPPLPVGLGTAESYSVLAGSEITNTLTTNLQQDLGVWPGTAVTGFPPGVTQGETHIGDSVAEQARIDANAAYIDAQGRIFTETVSGDIAGLTFNSGVFMAAAALETSADGIVTLDGEHDDNSVFIFQVGSALNIGARTRINLINGAQACHVFWQVGSAATIGAASTFNGTILASAAITVGATTTVDGRALAGSAITLADNEFVSGDCDSAPDGGGGDTDGGNNGGGDGGTGGDTDGGSNGGGDGGTGGGSNGATNGDGSGGNNLPDTGAGPHNMIFLALGLVLTSSGLVLISMGRRRPGVRRLLPGTHALRP